MKPMEITIPAESSEVTLKTGGKYCNKDIVVKTPIKIETGVFTIAKTSGETYATKITIPNVGNAKFVVAFPNFEPTHPGESVYNYMAHTICCSQFLNTRGLCKGVITDIYRQDTKAYVKKAYVYEIDGDNLTFDMKEGEDQYYFCEPGEYTYTAYYWD